MDDDLFDTKKLSILVVLLMGLVSLFLAIATNSIFLFYHGRFIFTASFILMVALYQGSTIAKYTTTKIFLAVFIAIHLLLLLFPFTLDSYSYSIFYIPFAVIDYGIFVFGLSFFLNKFRV